MPNSVLHETLVLDPAAEDTLLTPDLVVGRTALDEARHHAERLATSRRARRRRTSTRAIVERKTTKAVKERRAKRRARQVLRAAKSQTAR